MAHESDLSLTRETGRRRPRRRYRRWLLLVSVILSILTVAALIIEDSGLPNFTPGYDLSRTVILFASALSTLGGVAVVGSGMRLGLRARARVSRRGRHWRQAFRVARDRRHSAAAMIVFGALIALFSLAIFISRLGVQ